MLNVGQRHEVLAVSAHVDGVVVNRIFVSRNLPLQRARAKIRGNADAIVDSRLDLLEYYVVIKGEHLKVSELIFVVVN
ncbi:MAG: hypothetical protein ACRD3H_01020, partial [Terriglobales bacterium]